MSIDLRLLACLCLPACVAILACSRATADSAAHGLPSCTIAGISGLDTPDVTITASTDVAAAAPDREYCRVEGSVTTRGEGAEPGTAAFILKLPAEWNRRLVFFGCGGNCGSLTDIAANPSDVAAALASGYAVVNTDAGHEQDPSTPDPTWILLAPGVPNRPAIVDFYYRAVHDVSVAAKVLAQGYYSARMAHAYFDGCSTGGRQALMEGDRFPDDFDGLIAGDPIMDLDLQRAATIKQAKAFLQLAAYIPFPLIPVIDAAVDANCDTTDGVADGLIQNPALCSFDPHSLVPATLTGSQAAAFDLFLERVVDPRGTVVAPGMTVGDYASSGFEGQAEISTAAVDPTGAQPWGGIGLGPDAWVIGDAGIRYFIERNPGYDVNNDWPERGNVIADAAIGLLERRAGAGDSDDAEKLQEYLARDGKIILYHGFSDAQASPYRSIWFYRALAVAQHGYTALQQHARLFMVPGMGHCGAGSGPNVFETLDALDAWVTNGVGPEGIVATNTLTGRTMPLCKFPEEARYVGGPVNSASGWTCAANDQRLLQIGPDGTRAGAGR